MRPAALNRPRILLYCDRRGWAYHTTATQLIRHLQDRYDFDVVFAEDDPTFDASAYDIVYVFWWAERKHRAHVFDSRKIVKEISSHRWEHQGEFGLLAPGQADERWMNDAGWLVTTSRRLAHAFRPVGKPVFQYALGVNPVLFHPGPPRQGDLVVGWAGNPADPAKRFREILLPACGSEFNLQVADGKLSWEAMPEFFRSLDVILVASIGEGTPLPLLEAMACGCFPVTTDVGIAPEVIEHGRNGLIVEPTIEAFREALCWCRDHLEDVRRAGQENVALVGTTRTWQHSAAQFSEILGHIIMKKGQAMPAQDDASQADDKGGYEQHFERINPDGFSDSAYGSSVPYLRQDIASLLPKDRSARILEIGTGHGHFLRFLAQEGYTRILGIDLCEPMLRELQKRLTHLVERLEVADAAAYLPQHKNRFDCIVMLDVIEHFPLEDARRILAAAAESLVNGGRLILRTPNMANLLGGYSLYMDLTHRHGYTEWSLVHLLEQCALPGAQPFVPTEFGSTKRKAKALLNAFLHRMLYRLNARAEPKWYGKNIVVWVNKRLP